MNLETLLSPVVIRSAEELARLAHDLSQEPRLAVDTESNSLHAYRERVCLIQFSTPRHDYVVDPLALADLSPLAPILASPAIEKVFHAAEYDLLCLRRDYGFTFANLFDTMQAGRILGRRQAGLDRLLSEKFGIQVSKHLQKADWGARPLSPTLLRYACLDTHYLLPLRDMLQAELEARGLWALAQEDFRLACNGDPLKPKNGSRSWARFRARRDLSDRDLTILGELSAWRERTAAELDRPLFKVMNDDKLAAIAQARPSNLKHLSALGLSGREIQRWGPSLLAAVRRGKERPLVTRQPSEHPDAARLKRLERLRAWRKKVAAQMDVESDVVLPRFLMLALAERPAEWRKTLECSPWRLEHFGEQISSVLTL